jgi:hypothetical protein
MPASRTNKDAQAAEAIAAANAETYRFGADRRAYTESGESFLLERSYGRLKTALAQTPLTIVDHRLSPAQGPVLDLRNPPAARGGATSSAPAGASANAARRAATPANSTPANATPEIDLPE